MLQPRERSINAAPGAVRRVCFWHQGRGDVTEPHSRRRRQGNHCDRVAQHGRRSLPAAGREHLGRHVGQCRNQPTRGAAVHQKRRAQPVRRTPAAIVVNELSSHTTDPMRQRVRPAMSAAVCARGVDDARPVLTSHSTTPDDPTGQPVAAAADSAPKPLVPTTRLAWLTPDHAVNESRPSCKPPGPLRVQRVQPPVPRPAAMGENFYGKSLTMRKWVMASGR
jgi:hypothetical protein